MRYIMSILFSLSIAFGQDQPPAPVDSEPLPKAVADSAQPEVSPLPPPAVPEPLPLLPPQVELGMDSIQKANIALAGKNISRAASCLGWSIAARVGAFAVVWANDGDAVVAPLILSGASFALDITAVIFLWKGGMDLIYASGVKRPSAPLATASKAMPAKKPSGVRIINLESGTD